MSQKISCVNKNIMYNDNYFSFFNNSFRVANSEFRLERPKTEEWGLVDVKSPFHSGSRSTAEILPEWPLFHGEPTPNYEGSRVDCAPAFVSGLPAILHQGTNFLVIDAPHSGHYLVGKRRQVRRLAVVGNLLRALAAGNGASHCVEH